MAATNPSVVRKFVYVAVGPQYREEAIASAQSLKRHNRYPVCLITDSRTQDAIWDEEIVLEAPDRSIKDKLEMDRCEADEVMFIDGDTYITGDLTEAFDLLKRFDMVARQDWSGRDYQLEGVPESFPEFNTGVLLFRKNDRVQKFFDQWKHWFEEYLPEMGREMDQRSFRKAVFDSPDIKTFVLPPEYNQMTFTMGAHSVPVKVVHGRPVEGLAAVAKALNARPALGRVYVPKLGVFYKPADWYVLDYFKKGMKLLALGVSHFFERLTRRVLGRSKSR